MAVRSRVSASEEKPCWPGRERCTSKARTMLDSRRAKVLAKREEPAETFCSGYTRARRPKVLAKEKGPAETFCPGYTRAQRRERVSEWGWGPTRNKKRPHEK